MHLYGFVNGWHTLISVKWVRCQSLYILSLVRLIPHIGPTMHYANLPFSFSRDHSAILEAAQTYCRFIGVLALGVYSVSCGYTWLKAKISSLGLKRRGAIETLTNLLHLQQAIKVTTAHILVSSLNKILTYITCRWN